MLGQGLAWGLFIMLPLLAIWPLGFVAGTLIQVFRHLALHRSRPDYRAFFLNGFLSSAVMIELGFILTSVVDLAANFDTGEYIAVTFGSASALVWMVWIPLSCGVGHQRSRRWATVGLAGACLALGLVIGLRMR